MARELLRLSGHERELLAQNYDFYCDLANGYRSPTTDAQRYFAAACRGDVEPTTEHELAYLNLRRLARLAHMTERQVVAYGFAVEVSIGDDEMVPALPVDGAAVPKPGAQVDLGEFEEFGEMVPRPGWFTDEGWRRMRAGYRFDSR